MVDHFVEVYKSAPEYKFEAPRCIVDGGLVSISHWGAFDISPFGALISVSSIEWQRNGEPFETITIPSYQIESFIVAVRG